MNKSKNTAVIITIVLVLFLISMGMCSCGSSKQTRGCKQHSGMVGY